MAQVLLRTNPYGVSSQEFERVIQVLTGKKKGSLNDFSFWAGIEQLLSTQRKSRLYEAVAKYFLRILSGKIEVSIDNFGLMVPLLEWLVFMKSPTHEEAQLVLSDRGVFDAFKQKILNYSANDNIILIGLSLYLTQSCRSGTCCPKLKSDEYEKIFRVLRRCCALSDRLHPFLKQELPFVIAQLAQDSKDYKSLKGVISEGLGHDLSLYALKRLTTDITKADDLFGVRVIEAISKLLYIPEIHPSLGDIASSQPYLDCALELFGKRYANIKVIDPSVYGLQLQHCRDIMSRDVFLNKFVPRFVEELPNSLMEDYRPNVTSKYYVESLVGYISMAHILDQKGRFQTPDKLALIIAKLFACVKVRLMFREWEFLQKMFNNLDFRAKLLAMREMTSQVLSNLLSVLSCPTPPEIAQYDNMVLMFEVEAMKIIGKLPVWVSTRYMTCPECQSSMLYEAPCKSCQYVEKRKQMDEDVETLMISAFAPALTLKDFNESAVVGQTDFNSEDYAAIYTSAISVEKLMEAKNASTTRAPREGPKVDDPNEKPTVYGAPKLEPIFISVAKDDDIFKEPVPKVENEAKTALECTSCGRRGMNLLLCGRCQSVYYCNQDCQRADWKKGHKQACKPYTNSKNV